MDIVSSGNHVVIEGNIKSVSDYQSIKETLDALTKNQKTVRMTIKDSISITSSVIGFLTKLVQKEGVELSIEVGDSSLYELFDDLNLKTLFKVIKI